MALMHSLKESFDRTVKPHKKQIISVTKNAVTVTVSVLLILFIIYQSFGGFKQPLSTVITKIATETETLESDGYIFRDEKPIFSSYRGAVKYLVDNGARVSVGDELALSYSEPTEIDVYARKTELEARRTLLEACLDVSFSEIQDAEKMSDETLKKILAFLSEGDVESVLLHKEKWLQYLSRLQVFEVGETERKKRINEELTAIDNELLVLEYSFKGSSTLVKTDVSGYYFYYPDGYEEIFSSSLIEELTLEKFNELKERAPADVTGAAGKMVYDFEWYMTVPVKAEKAYAMTVGSYYNVYFPEEHREMKMYLEKIVDSAESMEALLVFSTTTMPSNFSYRRVQNVEITLSSVSGYSVPAAALRVIDGVQGVYILDSGNVYFRKVEVIKNGDGYYLVKERDVNSEDYLDYLNLNDSIIVSGKNLYDGKVIG